MNDISYFFIMLFGVIFGFVFPDLLEELGLAKKLSHSWLAVLLLTFLSLLGFLFFPIVIFGNFVINNLDCFYKKGPTCPDSGGIFLWLAIALLIGGGAHLAYHIFREKK